MPAKRTSRREHDTPTKNRFIGRILGGQKTVEAAGKENIPYDTAVKIMRKYKETGTVKNRPRSGRPPKVTPREERHIIQNARNHRRKPLGELSKETASNVSRTTVRRVLDDNVYHRCIALSKPLLRSFHRKDRMGWATYRKDHGTIDFNSTIFSDECCRERRT